MIKWMLIVVYFGAGGDRTITIDSVYKTELDCLAASSKIPESFCRPESAHLDRG